MGVECWNGRYAEDMENMRRCTSVHSGQTLFTQGWREGRKRRMMVTGKGVHAQINKNASGS